jgi:hypothetical protein
MTRDITTSLMFCILTNSLFAVAFSLHVFRNEMDESAICLVIVGLIWFLACWVTFWFHFADLTKVMERVHSILQDTVGARECLRSDHDHGEERNSRNEGDRH